jgi:hypothetical protein
MPLILGTNSVKGGYDVANSLRFNDGSSDYLGLNPSTSSSTKTFTYSFWTKRSLNAADRESYLGAGASGDQNHITIGSNYVQVRHYAGGHTFELYTSALLKDPSAWYHIVVAVDTTQGTAANRIKIYINGTQVSSFSTETYPDQNFDFDFFQNGATTYIGRRGHSVAYKLNSYLCEVAFIDGSQLAATSFGEFDEDSPTVWKPKDFKSDVTFGNGGFYLEFKQSGTSQNSSGLGADTSGNDNHFAVTNLTSVDQSTDTCTNNFATMNPVSKGSDITISEGNLKVSNGASDNSIIGNVGFGNGKWYWEAKCTGSSTYANIGVTRASVDGSNHSAVDAGRVVYSHNGNVYKEGLGDSATATGTTFTTNDIVSVAYDAQNGSVKFYKGGVLVNTTTDTDLLYSNYEYITSVGINDGGFELNFGSPPYSISSGNSDANGHGNFEYAVPSGYFALCTKNLAEHG